MDPRQLFADSRLTGFCVYCGGAPETRDHVPSRVLLDEPYPSNLPVVECCAACNGAFSLHEEYLACFLSCVVAGSTSPDSIERPKVARILRDNPALAERIQTTLQPSKVGERIWIPEMERVRTVILKLARGHIAYELSLPHIEEPLVVHAAPLALMSPEDKDSFVRPQETPFWPEIGSRAFVRAANGQMTPCDEWHIIQPNRYQYLVSQADGDFVRLVIGNYLACEVRWD